MNNKDTGILVGSLLTIGALAIGVGIGAYMYRRKKVEDARWQAEMDNLQELEDMGYFEEAFIKEDSVAGV